MDSLLIAGIDPGLASGGMVMIDSKNNNRIIGAYSLVEERGAIKQAKSKAAANVEHLQGWSDKEFLTAIIRAQNWINDFNNRLDEFINQYRLPDFFAVESFVDQRSRAREEKQRLIKNRWHTPLVMGMLATELTKRGINPENKRIIYQNAGIVIRQFSVEIGKLKARDKSKQEDIFLTDDHKIQNDHQRKALAHALALSLRLRQNQRQEKEKNGQNSN